MSRRRAARKIVSPSRMSISRSSMKKVSAVGALPSPTILSAGAACETPGLPPPTAAPPATPALSWPYPAGLLVSFMARSYRLPTSQRLGQFVRKILQDAQQRVGRRLPEPADRRVAHQRRELRQQRGIPRALLHQLDGFLAANAARRAL